MLLLFFRVVTSRRNCSTMGAQRFNLADRNFVLVGHPVRPNLVNLFLQGHSSTMFGCRDNAISRSKFQLHDLALPASSQSFPSDCACALAFAYTSEFLIAPCARSNTWSVVRRQCPPPSTPNHPLVPASASLFCRYRWPPVPSRLSRLFAASSINSLVPSSFFLILPTGPMTACVSRRSASTIIAFVLSSFRDRVLGAAPTSERRSLPDRIRRRNIGRPSPSS